MLVRGVGPIGQQREMQIAFRARKVMNLETFDQLFDRLPGVVSSVGTATSVRRSRGHAVEKSSAGKKRRGEAGVDPAIDQRHGGVDGGNGAEHAKQAKTCRADSGKTQSEQRRRKKDRGDKRNRRHIAADADGSVDARRPASQRAADRRSTFRTRGVRRRAEVSGVPPALPAPSPARRPRPASPPVPQRWRYRARVRPEPRDRSSTALR